MTTVNAEYTITVKIPDLSVSNLENRVDLERKIKEAGQKRILGLLTNNLFDPQGKVFSESIKVIPNE